MSWVVVLYNLGVNGLKTVLWFRKQHLLINLFLKMELPTFKKCDNKLFESIALPQGDQELIKCKTFIKYRAVIWMNSFWVLNLIFLWIFVCLIHIPGNKVNKLSQYYSSTCKLCYKKVTLALFSGIYNITVKKM